MEDRSYRLAQYEIIEKGSGEIWWKAHGGFADYRRVVSVLLKEMFSSSVPVRWMKRDS